jgi:serine/threonine-protein kinase
MHKHLKQPLIPPDHINTSLSAGIGEIIETAMAKNRDERYASTEDMLEDLWAVRRGESPIHARKAFDVEKIAKIEETARTVDLEPPAAEQQPIWIHPVVVTLIALGGFSIVVNLILIVVMLTR